STCLPFAETAKGRCRCHTATEGSGNHDPSAREDAGTSPAKLGRTCLVASAVMDYLVILLLQIGSAVASLVLLSIGLAVIFGMMRVINLAHGEFLMLGGYAAITAYNHGVNLWLAMVLVAPLAVGIFGVIVERLVIRHLYGRLIDTMLATWGLSLAM